ncbi:Reticulocyte-binding protein 2 -like protein a [Collichthys lucidus]|uniref:Reticulocyte-binding protein 2-like protein a n=1 Tax=Collichthys lucidus TaxID=240159 RepID=A0A4U5TXA0_COLLU|nr:Reticulocyte-binding protein 2 -like protein a [Collichthys lucidus]
MGNAPSESNMGDRLRCCKCYKVLPPCNSFDDLNKHTVHGRYVYVYNGGEYYRPVGYDNMYECEYCFNKPIRDRENMRREEERRRQEERQRREEERRRQEERQRREEERRRQEERQRREEERREEERQRREEERRKAEEKKRQEELNQRLQESHQRVKEQHEKLRNISEESVMCKQPFLRSHLDDSEADDESGSDEFLEILSLKCSIPVPSLSLSQLTAEQLEKIRSVLDELLFDEWIGALPSLSTLQHAQVFITEQCVLFLEIPEGVSLQIISDHVQSLVESISQSACNVFESFLLTQALYINLMHFCTDYGSSDTDAALMAKLWAGDELSTEQLFPIEFLSTLTASLQNVVERASVLILNMEIQCLKLLLSTLKNLNGKETLSESTEMLLRLVQTNQWTPTEAMTLFKALLQKYSKDVSITEVLTLVQVYDISPEWTNESGHSLIQALDFAGPERLHQDFHKTLRSKDERNLVGAPAELKMLKNLDDSVIDMIKNINTSIQQYSENDPKDEDAPFMKDSFKCVTLNADDRQNCLFQLCRAVFETKGQWPTVSQMLRWCALVLTEKSGAIQVLGMEEDPCVTAMFAATQACMGNKLAIMLSSDIHSEKQTKEWSDFYKYFEISLNTNMKKTNVSYRDVYEMDIVYGTISDFVSDYLQYSIEGMETGNPQFSRQFIIEEQSLTSSHNLELSKLMDNDSLLCAAEVLQNLMGKFHSECVKLRHKFIKALFQVLHNLIKDTNTDDKIITILKKITGQGLPPNRVFILTFLENLLKVVTEETESEETSPASKWCLEIVFACAEQFQTSATTKELFQIVSDLEAQRLWSPVEALNLLGALTDHHHDEDCISIMKILHLMTAYQVSTKWTDDNNQSLLELLDSFTTVNLIKHLEQSLRDEKTKSIETLFDELRRMKDIDEQTLTKSYNVVTHVTNLIKTGDIKNHTDLQQAKNLSHSTDTKDLQEFLAVLCNAVHLHQAGRKWWPRATQMISWCLLVLSDTGKLLEMGTGEGKSCVIAMFAVLRVLRGETVDVVSSSSVLCQRDAKEWTNFYKYFGVTADTNTNKTTDEDRKECYQKDVVYGTIEAFAADHLRQIFEMKDVRPDRSYQCIIIDEVDSLLLDQGVQLTYLSSPMVSMQHLNIILAMIWGNVSQYGFLSTGHQSFVQGPPASFFKAIFDSIDTEETEINDPMDILHIAEELNTVPKGFTEELYRSEKDELLRKLKTVSQDAVVDFFEEIENRVPYGFTVYTLDDNGLLCLRKNSQNNNQDIQELTFLVLEEGLCCALYYSEEILIKAIADLISEKVQYTPCTNNKDKISIPGFLKNLVDKKMSVWVQNAFLAMQLKEGREYVVENDHVCPVDFRSTGIVELNKKWGDGLQQFVEIKHQIKLSTISIVTNYISNISFFEKYHGKIYGTTGTLGSKADILFLQDLYPNLAACKMPAFNRRKLYEVKGTLKTSNEEWKAEIKRVIMAEISPNSYRDGRAALVICETINKAKEIHEDLKSSIPGKVILYCRNDGDSLSQINSELLPGDVIVATNLAGRGTDIKVSKQVNNNGGLFVILSFLSENTRVELQAFGRTARKGKPGSAQVIMSSEHRQHPFRTVSSLEEAKSTRDRFAAEKINHIMNDVAELKLREDLFSEYCKTLQDIHKNTDGDDKRAVVAIMNEFWGIWLQTKSEEIEQIKRNELQNSLKADLSWAKSQSQSHTSPCSSIYHYIKFGNIALSEKQWDVSTSLFEKAMQQDDSWAAIAFYNHAYCTIKQQNGDYLLKAKNDLVKAKESLKYLSEESMVCLQFVKMSSANSANSNPTSLEKQLTTKCMMLSYFDKNIDEAIQKLGEIKERGRDAKANKSPIISLVSNADEDLQVEANNLYSGGLRYVFSVEEEPRFSWEGLLVFCLGILQIIGGTLLTAFTFGTFAQIGMGLITEGISDCISGVEAMVTGEFSWKSWAIAKAISIGVSLFSFGVGKLIAKGFKASMTLIKGFGKQLKAMPKFLSGQVKEGLSVAAKTNMKNAAKYTAKKIAEEIVIYGLGKAEEKILTELLNSIKNDVKEAINDNVKSNMKKEPLTKLVDIIILSHVDSEKQLHDLLEDKNRRSQLLAIFKDLSNNAVQPFHADLWWQNKLNSSISQVIDKVKAVKGVKGTARGILTAIEVVHLSSLAVDAIIAVNSLSSKFFSNLHEQLNKYIKEKQENGFSQKMKVNELSTSDTEMLKKFKQDLADTISTVLADALVEVFHQKFSSHLVSHAQNKINSTISRQLRNGLKSDRTEEKLRAGQNNRYIVHMPVDQNSKHELAGEAGKHSQSHAEKIRNPDTVGTIFDIRILSETGSLKNTRVVILTENSHGKLTKMHELGPDAKYASETVTLIYRPKSAQYPNGHYDVRLNNQTVNIENHDKSCLFQALARARNAKASQWKPFIKRKEWIEATRGGDWYLAEGGGRKRAREEKQFDQKQVAEYVGKGETYREWKKDLRKNPGLGQYINGDHQPPVDSILEARRKNQNSKLANAMLEVGTKSSPLNPDLIDNVHKYHGLDLPIVSVPRAMHYEFPSTKSPSFRKYLATTIRKDDVVGAFKLTILGAMPRFKLDSIKNFKNFKDSNVSQTRLAIFENSFQKHSENMVQTWYNLLQDKGVMTHDHHTTITEWIKHRGYDDQNDPHRKQVCNLLK